MYTENEAKTKWCPINAGFSMLTASSDLSKGINTSEKSLHTAMTCKGSSCMMWKLEPIGQTIQKVVEHNINNPDDLLTELEIEKIGYCGLTK